MSDFDLVSLGDKLGNIRVKQMTAKQYFQWDNPPQTIRRDQSGAVTIITDPVSRERVVFEILGSCCESEDGLVVDRQFIETLPAKDYKRIYAAFRRVNELDEQPTTEAERDEQSATDVGNLKLTA